MSTYPSTADLAAFRSAIRDTHPVPAITDPAYHDGNFFGQAWPHEREQGIGHRIPAVVERGGPYVLPAHETVGRMVGPVGFIGDTCRREASRMRSEAFARSCRCKAMSWPHMWGVNGCQRLAAYAPAR